MLWLAMRSQGFALGYVQLVFPGLCLDRPQRMLSGKMPGSRGTSCWNTLTSTIVYSRSAHRTHSAIPLRVFAGSAVLPSLMFATPHLGRISLVFLRLGVSSLRLRSVLLCIILPLPHETGTGARTARWTSTKRHVESGIPLPHMAGTRCCPTGTRRHRFVCNKPQKRWGTQAGTRSAPTMYVGVGRPCNGTFTCSCGHFTTIILLVLGHKPQLLAGKRTCCLTYHSASQRTVYTSRFLDLVHQGGHLLPQNIIHLLLQLSIADLRLRIEWLLPD